MSAEPRVFGLYRCRLFAPLAAYAKSVRQQNTFFMIQVLRDALARQYAAFQAPRPRSIVACDCCNTPERVGRLLASPREKLAATDLGFYAFKAVTTIGGPDELRYYWPRLVELAVNREFALDPEILFGKLVLASHHLWPAEERQALHQFAGALGEWLGSEVLEPFEADSWVCVIGRMSENLWDPVPFLEPLKSDSPAAWSNICSLVEVNNASIRKKRRLQSAFWMDAPKSAALVLEWLSSEPRAVEARRELARRSHELY